MRGATKESWVKRKVNGNGTPWNKGKIGIYSEETLKKMAYEKTPEHRAKIGLTSKGRFAGEKNVFWVGGSIKYFKRVALRRDNYTCQKCGFSDKEIMQVDHIKPRALFPELFKELSNLMTLCPNCHARKSNVDKRLIYSLKRAKLNAN